MLDPKLAEVFASVRVWLQMNEVEKRFFRCRDKRMLASVDFDPAGMAEQVSVKVPQLKNAQRSFPGLRTTGADTGRPRDVLGNQAVECERGLEAYVGTEAKMVGDQKGMWPDLLIWRSQAVKPSAQLMESPGAGPTGDLTANFISFSIPSEEQARFEDRLVADEGENLFEIHGVNMPCLLIWRNRVAVDPMNRSGAIDVARRADDYASFEKGVKTTFVAVEKDLVRNLRDQERRAGVSMEILVNLWLQEKLAVS